MAGRLLVGTLGNRPVSGPRTGPVTVSQVVEPSRLWSGMPPLQEVMTGRGAGGGRVPSHVRSADLLTPGPDATRRERIVLAGDVPSPIDKPTGCSFHPRCRYATEICKVERPVLTALPDGRQLACHHPLI